jgi:hypothetical protein
VICTDGTFAETDQAVGRTFEGLQSEA